MGIPCLAPNRSCWDGTGTKALPPRQDSHLVTLIKLKEEEMAAITKYLNHLISHRPWTRHSMTKGCKAGSSVLQAIHPVTLTCKMCCSAACSTQNRTVERETRDEATPTPRYRLLLARYSEIPHRYCLHKKGFGPKDQI